MLIPHANSDGAGKVPEVSDSAELFCIDAPSIRRPQVSQMTAPHDAEEFPVPINDRTKGPTMALIAPP
jgi:hypothetical protein